ncbi:MAG: hypothetical protein AB1442_07200 [Nitrospirota bacterium]
MKRLIFVCIFVLISFSLAYAQAKGDVPREQKTEETQSGQGHQMPMMECPKMKGEQQMMCPMMGHMRGGPGMAMRDMQYMILNILKTQQKMIRGLNAAEKKELTKETDKMMDRMEKMMFEEKGMMGHMPGAPAEGPGPEMKSGDPSQKGEPSKPDPHGH